MEGKKLMAIRAKRIKASKKGLRGLLAEKAAVQAVKARKMAREKPHSGVKAALLKAKNKGKRRKGGIPTMRA
jgi:hypothetical protein